MPNLSSAEVHNLPSRRYAEKHHKSIGGTDYWGIQPSPEAIGGYYGIAWHEVYEDDSGERYKVRCTDGVYGGRGPYREEDMR